MKLNTAIFEKKWVKWSLIGGGIFIVFYTLFGFAVLPAIVRSVLADKLSVATGRMVTIEKVSVNPYALTININGVNIRERNGTPLMSLDELFVNLQTFSVLKRALVLKELRVVKPDIHVVRTGPDTFNFSDLIPASAHKTAPEPETQPQPETGLFRFLVENISLTDGAVYFADQHVGVDQEMTGIFVSIPRVSSLPKDGKTPVMLHFGVKINGTPASLEAESLPFDPSLKTRLLVQLEKLDVLRGLSYITMPEGLNVDSAFVAGRMDLNISRQNGRFSVLASSGSLTVSDARVNHGENLPLMNMPELEVTLAGSDLLNGPYHFAGIRMNSPELYLRRDKDGQWELASLGGEKPGEKMPPETTQTAMVLPLIDVDEVNISGASAVFSDMFMAAPFQLRSEQIALCVKQFSTRETQNADYTFSAQTDAGETIASSGRFCINPLTAEGTVDLTGLILKQYAPYYQKQVRFEIADGQAGMHTGFRFAADPQVLVFDGVQLSLQNLKVHDPAMNRSILTIPEFFLTDSRIDAGAGSVVLGRVSTKGGNAYLQRATDGTINWQTLVSADTPSQSEKSPSGEKTSWNLVLNHADLTNWAVEFEDRTMADPVRVNIEKIAADVQGVGTAVEQPGRVDLSFQWNKNGTVAVKGGLRLAPLKADLAVSANKVDIRSVQPYFTDRVKLLVTDGSCGAKGQLAIFQNTDDTVGSTYTGDVFVTEFASVDRAFSKDFLKWDSLYVSGADIGYNPTRVSIAEVALSNFFSLLIVESDGKINLQSVMVPQQQEKEPEPAAEEKTVSPVPVRIDAVTFQGGTVKFSDFQIQPNFEATLLALGGNISGLVSEESQNADVFLKGRLNNYAPLEITGKINPLIRDLFADIRFSFKDIQLSPFTPYTGRYLGYQLQKGKLNLSLVYSISQGKLQGQNKVVLDQLTLGKSVKSAEATSLPVKMAIALLKDRKGVINLDLPVRGELDDPEFRIGKVVMMVLGNVITKVVTSPFAALGAMFGGGEDLSYIEFDDGSSELSSKGLKKISDLESALYQRPGLTLEIQGEADSRNDRSVLQKMAFEQGIKSQKLNEMLRTQPDMDLSVISISPEERAAYVGKAYDAGQFPKPRKADGKLKELSTEEMEKLLLTHTRITDADLRSLAYERAETVRAQIMGGGKVEENRVFILEPERVADRQSAFDRKNRVRFSLR